MSDVTRHGECRRCGDPIEVGDEIGQLPIAEATTQRRHQAAAPDKVIPDTRKKGEIWIHADCLREMIEQ